MAESQKSSSGYNLRSGCDGKSCDQTDDELPKRHARTDSKTRISRSKPRKKKKNRRVSKQSSGKSHSSRGKTRFRGKIRQRGQKKQSKRLEIPSDRTEPPRIDINESRTYPLEVEEEEENSLSISPSESSIQTSTMSSTSDRESLKNESPEEEITLKMGRLTLVDSLLKKARMRSKYFIFRGDIAYGRMGSDFQMRSGLLVMKSFVLITLKEISQQEEKLYLDGIKQKMDYQQYSRLKESEAETGFCLESSADFLLLYQISQMEFGGKEEACSWSPIEEKGIRLDQINHLKSTQDEVSRRDLSVFSFGKKEKSGVDWLNTILAEGLIKRATDEILLDERITITNGKTVLAERNLKLAAELWRRNGWTHKTRREFLMDFTTGQVKMKTAQ